ncbi:transcriptional repressor [Oscillospiraceae bacterium PP1C4]
MNYSRQRELIYQTVMQNAIHPNADTVYALVRAQDPNISLGTVYRNLNLLCEQGQLRKISVPNTSDCFDGRCDEHHHLICTRCGKVFDISLGDLFVLDEQIKNSSEFTVTGYQLLIEGICKSCIEITDKI